MYGQWALVYYTDCDNSASLILIAYRHFLDFWLYVYN